MNSDEGYFVAVSKYCTNDVLQIFGICKYKGIKLPPRGENADIYCDLNIPQHFYELPDGAIVWEYEAIFLDPIEFLNKAFGKNIYYLDIKSVRS